MDECALTSAASRRATRSVDGDGREDLDRRPDQLVGRVAELALHLGAVDDDAAVVSDDHHPVGRGVQHCTRVEPESRNAVVHDRPRLLDAVHRDPLSFRGSGSGQLIGDEPIGEEPEEPPYDRHRDAMGETCVGGPAFDAVGELVATEQLDIGVLRPTRHDLDVGIESRHETSADGRPGDRDDRRFLALPRGTQPHRHDRRRCQVDLVDTGGDPRRHVVAPCRRDEHAEPGIDVGAEPGNDLRVRKVQSHEVVDEHCNHPSNVMPRSCTRRTAGNRVLRPAAARRDLRPCSTPVSCPYRRPMASDDRTVLGWTSFLVAIGALVIVVITATSVTPPRRPKSFTATTVSSSRA